ncbi:MULTISPECIES: NAD(P)/FAD-dependent oxidoreductase [unclassified Polaromonas]|jgi:NADPH-dependent 2,4-dienoyl-CoA reductase/sulfur reductase-like enzyme|uniref:NAD(P)/FAD-dependent oxidoreductase n=1 Tax=unclassified Polaromonas TaxID=2638319 RepID=UPI000BDBA360|nr:MULTISPECIES: NAD(P)/FAD-dependent oxidoreductase [unclassified Polaromonas]OYY32586.1 MAG: flavocytochrome C [Polaromonas sp. 35-63-35]OYZ16218.1 MAG: flavocytochrome C [Polaromonas sp. 16-63-31]OYZ75904.1 MAG: flavocytochrome C [Polaromonas sp. 24-63-21]OZA47242.1 MAG: flavocytochrome C [Polaromonas sp. 17-63-33]OZA85335.1 MAG: flavocytochrome C [Polaromonas sp. 39-63-25]
MKRRNFVQASLALGTLGSMVGCATTGTIPNRAKVLVIGGGYGGATAAKYVRMLSNYKIDVVMVEPNTAFISCPISNLVLGGSKTMGDITTPYDKLSGKHGVTVVKDMVSAIDAAKKTVTLAGGATIGYDKLILSPGIDLMWDSIEGLQAANASGQILQAWKAGPETLALRRQLEAMPDGGVYAITIPLAPYRCPPGPYERASQVASYFKKAKPKSKVLILDANPDVTSKGPLFKKFWAENYQGMLEYRGAHKAIAVDARTSTVKFEVQNDVKADVLNVLPTMSAGAIAMKSGLANANARWCNVDYLTFESTAARDVHIIGDSTLSAPLMPKSGHMANSHGKVVAAAVVAQLSGMTVNPNPVLTNTCYSFVNDKLVVHVASVHQYVAAEKTFKTVAGSGGVSAAPNELEGVYAWNWAQNIWADTLL